MSKLEVYKIMVAQANREEIDEVIFYNEERARKYFLDKASFFTNCALIRNINLKMFLDVTVYEVDENGKRDLKHYEVIRMIKLVAQ